MHFDTEKAIRGLMPWWEDVSILGIRTKSIDNKAGRNKDLLFRNLFDKRLGADFFRNKTVVDLGCNAGGSAVEMLKRGATFVKCIEGNELAFRQLNLVINSNQD